MRTFQRTDVLRGHLPPEEPGARGIEHWARNTACQRLSALLFTNISPVTALTQIYQLPDHCALSALAVQMGKRFEASLFAHHATRLTTLYQHAGLLPNHCRVLNLEHLIPLASPDALARRRLMTRRLVQQKVQGSTQVPHLILHGRLSFLLNNVAHDIEPDLLIADDHDDCYRPGEIKSSLDRGGKTGAADLRGALRQNAVALVALWQLLETLGYAAPSQIASAEADLILRRAGSLQARLHARQGIEEECASILLAIRQIPEMISAITQHLSPQATLDQPQILDQLSIHWTRQCHEFCPLESYCQQQALAASSLRWLGQKAEAFLAPAGTIARGLELIEGAHPHTSEEQELAHQFLQLEYAWRKAVRGS